MSLVLPSFPTTILPEDSLESLSLHWGVGQVFDAIEALASVYSFWVLIEHTWAK